MSNPYELVKNWFLNSGLVITDPSDENFGAVHSFYDIKSKSYGFLYPEITGYAISSCRFLHNIKKDQNLLKIARSSSDWIVNTYHQYVGIVPGIIKNKPAQKIAYSFDTAVCAKGMLDCYMITKEQKYLNYGEQWIGWILDEAMDSDGTIKPYKNLRTKKFEEDNNVWYKQKGCLHIKTAIPILQLYQLTKNQTLLEKAIMICNTISLYQNKDGSILLHSKNRLVHLHTLCYALEGLLYAYHVVKDENYLNSCIKALDWCISKIEDDGSVPLWFNSHHQQSKTSYHIAQLMRIMILVSKIHDADYQKHVDKLCSFLLTLQVKSQDARVSGSFYEEMFKSILSWKIRQKINSWGSMFALQALYWKENYQKISFNEAIELLY